MSVLNLKSTNVWGMGVLPYMGYIHVGMCGKWKPLLVSNSHILED